MRYFRGFASGSDSSIITNILYIDKHTRIKYPVIAMQVSLYIDDQLIKKLDSQAKKRKKSRSAFLQDLLKDHLLQHDESVFDEVFGILAPAVGDKFIESTREGRKNSSRFG